MRAVTVFTRRGCHLCEELLEQIGPLIRDRGQLTVCDIDTRADWLERFNDKVPVVEVDGSFVCEYFLDPESLSAALLSD